MLQKFTPKIASSQLRITDKFEILSDSDTDHTFQYPIKERMEQLRIFDLLDFKLDIHWLSLVVEIGKEP